MRFANFLVLALLVEKGALVYREEGSRYIVRKEAEEIEWENRGNAGWGMSRKGGKKRQNSR